MTISLATTFFLHTHQTPGPEGSNRGNDDDGPDVAGGDSNNDNSGTNSVPHRSPSNLGEQVPAELTEHLQGEGAHNEEERVDGVTVLITNYFNILFRCELIVLFLLSFCDIHLPLLLLCSLFCGNVLPAPITIVEQQTNQPGLLSQMLLFSPCHEDSLDIREVIYGIKMTLF
jgi:hypothetical protein